MTRSAPKVIDLAAFREFDGQSGVGPHVARLPIAHIDPARANRSSRTLWAAVILGGVALGLMLGVTASAKAEFDTAGMVCPAPC